MPALQLLPSPRTQGPTENHTKPIAPSDGPLSRLLPRLPPALLATLASPLRVGLATTSDCSHTCEQGDAGDRRQRDHKPPWGCQASGHGSIFAWLFRNRCRRRRWRRRRCRFWRQWTSERRAASRCCRRRRARSIGARDYHPGRSELIEGSPPRRQRPHRPPRRRRAEA